MINFEWFLERFWDSTRSQICTKSQSTSLPKITTKKNPIGSPPDGFLEHFGLQLGTQIGPRPPILEPRSAQDPQLWRQDRPKTSNLEPRWPQDPLQTPPGTDFYLLPRFNSSGEHFYKLIFKGFGYPFSYFLKLWQRFCFHFANTSMSQSPSHVTPVARFCFHFAYTSMSQSPRHIIPMAGGGGDSPQAFSIDR